MTRFSLVQARSQKGLTLVEFVISMAVTSLVLAGLTGVVFATYQVTRTWSQRVYEAGAEELLPEALQADAHRYLACSPTADAFVLELCLPGTRSRAVTYATPSGCDAAAGCDLVRGIPDGSQSIVARGLKQRPRFTVTCTAGAASTSGVVTVTGLVFPAAAAAADPAARQQPIVVYFSSPAGGCGT